jgi:hypothetical protein
MRESFPARSGVLPFTVTRGVLLFGCTPSVLCRTYAAHPEAPIAEPEQLDVGRHPVLPSCERYLLATGRPSIQLMSHSPSTVMNSKAPSSGLVQA